MILLQVFDQLRFSSNGNRKGEYVLVPIKILGKEGNCSYKKTYHIISTLTRIKAIYPIDMWCKKSHAIVSVIVAKIYQFLKSSAECTCQG